MGKKISRDALKKIVVDPHRHREPMVDFFCWPLDTYHEDLNGHIGLMEQLNEITLYGSVAEAEQAFGTSRGIIIERTRTWRVYYARYCNEPEWFPAFRKASVNYADGTGWHRFSAKETA